jgi:hypothetical protein
MNKFKMILFSWDIYLSLPLSLISYFFLPKYLEMEFTLSFFNIGITVISIIFSLFFAALAIIMSSSDNDFLEFLEQKNQFTTLLWTFKVTLIALFCTLIYSIVLYTGTQYYIVHFNPIKWEQHKILFIFFEFLFLYSMIATGLSINDTIVFSKFRAKFLKQQSDKAKNENRNT